jgi:uncharacterized repeat protein (TIGR03803 family)
MMGQKSRILLATTLRMLVKLAGVFVLTIGLAQSQTFTVLHSFTGGPDGANPLAGLAMDHAGNLYGTASLGGQGYGTVYKLAPRGGGWIFSPLYQFHGPPDGFYPEAGVTIAADGSLYGTTFYGGQSSTACIQGATDTCGTAFRLQPPPTACASVICPWLETQIYLFNNEPKFHYPAAGEMIFDDMGNLYGAALQGGTTSTNGGVYQFTPSGGGWTETNLYTFINSNRDGDAPVGGIIRDGAGNIYGTTMGIYPAQTTPYGSAYELSNSGAGWNVTMSYLFQNGNDGAFPKAAFAMDTSGNLYGTTSAGGPNGGGVVFELSPSQGGWVFNTLYSFNAPPGRGSFGPLLLDSAGNLYGTVLAGGAPQQGAVFKLTNVGGVWTYTSLHDFTGGSDGRSPYGHLLLDSSGNLYGTAGWGGSDGDGVVWKITP